jgi:hypothetical protein
VRCAHCVFHAIPATDSFHQTVRFDRSDTPIQQNAQLCGKSVPSVDDLTDFLCYYTEENFDAKPFMAPYR